MVYHVETATQLLVSDNRAESMSFKYLVRRSGLKLFIFFLKPYSHRTSFHAGR